MKSFIQLKQKGKKSPTPLGWILIAGFVGGLGWFLSEPLAEWIASAVSKLFGG